MDTILAYLKQYADYMHDNWTFSGVSAVCAMALTLLGQRATRRHNRLLVKPFLTDNTHWERADGTVRAVSLDIINQGLGPAFIKSFKVLHNNKPLSWKNHDDLEEQVKRFFPQGQIVSIHTFGKNAVLAARESKTLIKITVPSGKNRIKDVEAAFDGLNVKIKYESMYGESWQYHTGRWVWCVRCVKMFDKLKARFRRKK